MLQKKGYHAKLTELKSKQKIWYAVRLGSFTSKKSAINEAKIISNKENIEVALINNGIMTQIIRSKRKENIRNAALAESVQKMTSKKLRSSSSSMYSFQVGDLLSKKNALKQKNEI